MPSSPRPNVKMLLPLRSTPSRVAARYAVSSSQPCTISNSVSSNAARALTHTFTMSPGGVPGTSLTNADFGVNDRSRSRPFISDPDKRSAKDPETAPVKPTSYTTSVHQAISELYSTTLATPCAEVVHAKVACCSLGSPVSLSQRTVIGIVDGEAKPLLQITTMVSPDRTVAGNFLLTIWTAFFCSASMVTSWRSRPLSLMTCQALPLAETMPHAGRSNCRSSASACLSAAETARCWNLSARRAAASAFSRDRLAEAAWDHAAQAATPVTTSRPAWTENINQSDTPELYSQALAA